MRTHHKVIDDDPEAYTVERLLKPKEEHASRFAATSDEEAETGARILIDHLIASQGQSGGITAHTVNQVFNVHAQIANVAHDEHRQREARKYLAPELQRTIERVLYIHGRAIANFICYSADNGDQAKTTKRKIFFLIGRAYIPTRRRFGSSEVEDAAALIAIYRFLHSPNDHVEDWWEREGQLPVNLFNSFLHDASKSLKIALTCIDKFGLEKLFPPPYEAWGTTSARIRQSLNPKKKHPNITLQDLRPGPRRRMLLDLHKVSGADNKYSECPTQSLSLNELGTENSMDGRFGWVPDLQV